VSCASTGNCSAVGDYGNYPYQRGLLLDEVSGSWAAGVEASPPDDAAANPLVSLDSVSCPSPGNCGAVGHYSDGAGSTQGLLLDEVSGVWEAGIEVMPPGDAATNPWVSLNSISCASAGNCSAVGHYTMSSGQSGLVDDEVSGTWGPGIETAPSKDSATELSSVSCTSAGNCSAVGYYQDSSGDFHGLLLDEVSGTWETGLEALLPADAAGGSRLDSVSCASAGNCSAVGYYQDSSGDFHGLLLDEVSGTWETGLEALLPADAADSEDFVLASISCASAGNCSAVGYYQDSSGNRVGLLLNEVSGTWDTGVEVPVPAGAADDPYVVPTSVSCASPGNCSAVGPYNVPPGYPQGLLLREVSGTWETGVEAPLPAGADKPWVSLNSISCASANNCSAVGYTGEDSNGLVETLTPVVPRVFGQDAIGTAIAISQAQFPATGSASAVVLARSDFFSDALAGGPLAAKLNAPLLVTPGASSSRSIDPRVLSEIERVLPKGGTVYVLGGSLALSPEIDTTLEGLGYSVVREAGPDEYATAVDIAEQLGNPTTVFEVTGLNFYDSVSAEPAAVVEKGAILLTGGSTQAPETAAYLAAHPADVRYAIGGPLAAAGADPSATAIYGDDFYGTSAAVARHFFSSPTTFGSATSATFPDALVAGPVLGSEDAPMLLVPPSGALPSDVAQYLSDVASGLTGGTVYGGPLAVGDDVLGEIQSAI
jgi:hypothetical protein